MIPEKHETGLPIAEIAVPGVDKIFHYTIPKEFSGTAHPGVRAKVFLGRRTVTGYLVARKKKSDYPELKPLIDILDPFPLLTSEMIHLTRWISDYYFAPWGTVIRTALPKGLDAPNRIRVTLTEEGRGASKISPLFKLIRSRLEKEDLTLTQLERKIGKKKIKSQLHKYAKKGLLILSEEVRASIKAKTESVYRLGVDAQWLEQNLEAIKKRKPAQTRVLVDLSEAHHSMSAQEIQQQTGVGNGVIRNMVEQALLIKESREQIRDPFGGEIAEREPPPTLTQEQKSAVEEISPSLKNGAFETFLLYGVTGSGKTEVYLRTIHEALIQNKQAVVIVPEIALTPQLVRIFRSRFGNEIAVLHSGLSDGERFDQWNRIRKGDASVAIGARSAIFAPFSNLGLIVVDEEHDATYKQEETPRYHARDLAVVRAKITGAVVILGSATPSVESFYHARSGKYNLLTLSKRIEDRALPEVCLIDMKEEKGIAPLSPRLTDAVQQGLDCDEQILLFLNRRGFSPFLICSTCGFVLRCPNCSVSLTYHLKENILTCHHCEYTSPLIKGCPDCKGETLELKGSGTEKIEQEVEEAFEGSELLRLDRDTTRKKGSAQKILDKFRSQKGNILIGTQMVTKGHHLPGISTVGVLNADSSLHIPDFRSGERTFQILTQVAGRAGRGKTPGKVFMQSYTPEHYSIQAAKEHDYQGFFEQEIDFRKSLNYPPYRRLINIVLSANSLQLAEKAASRLGEILRTLPIKKQRVEILGPAKAPLSTLRGKKRFQILVKGEAVSSLHRIVGQGISQFNRGNGFSGVDLVVDVDPVNFL